MDLDNIQRKYGLPAPLPVVQNGKFATRFPLNLEHRGDDVFQFGGKYIGEIENIYDLLYKILTNQEIDASLALPYAIKITEDKLYIRDKTNSEWILIFDITKPNFPKEIELYELIYKAITHQVIGEDTSYPGQFKIEENILYVRDKDNLTWTQIGDVTKEFLGATEATQAILDQVNEILTEVQELKTELNRQIATTNETLTTALKAANEAMTSAQSINIRTFNSVEEMKASNTLKAGALGKTLGFYVAGDGGGANYLVVDTIAEDEADGASIIALQNGLYAKLLISNLINVKWFGAVGDNTHDDTEAINKANLFAKNTAMLFMGSYNNEYKYYATPSIFFPAGSYRITNSVTFYVGAGKIIADNAVINAEATVEKAVILEGIYTDEKSIYHFNNTWKIDGLKINCNRTGDMPQTTVGVQFANTTDSWKHLTNFTNVHIRGFAKAVSWGSKTYNNLFVNCVFKDCYTNLYIPDTVEDAYEHITFVNCIFCDSNTCVENHEVNGACYFIGCSFDYCYQTYIWADNGAKMFFNQCWFETNSDNSSNYPLIKVTKGTSSAGSLVIVSNSLIECRGSSKYTNGVFYCDIPRGGDIISGLYIKDTVIGYFNADNFVNGGGSSDFSNIYGYVNGAHPSNWQEDVYTLADVPFIPYGLRQDQSDYYTVSKGDDGILKIRIVNNSKPSEIYPYFITPVKDNERITLYCKIKGSSKLEGSSAFINFVFGYGYIEPATGKLVSIYKQGEKRLNDFLNQSVDQSAFIQVTDGLSFNKCRYTDMCPYPIVAYAYVWIGNAPVGYEISFSEFLFKRVVI